MSGLKSIIFLIFCFGSLQSFSQSCDCPPASGCAPCVGGLTSLTLRFNGATSSTVTASDQIGTVFNNIVSPGQSFTFTGSISNDKFAGSNVTVTVNGINNATVSSNCAGAAFIGSAFGSFTVVAASSKNGGSICCQSADVDNQPPAISNCPGNIVRSLTTDCNLIVTWTPPTVNDNCSVVSFISSHNSGDEFDLGTTSVTYTATDGYGNESICTFDVIINDNTLPTFTSCPANIIVSANGACQASVDWIEPTATDNCSVATQNQTHHPEDIFVIGTTTVTYTATDDSGNSSTCSFTVTVEDTTVPVFSGCPVNITLAAGSNCKAVAAWTEPLATDNCGIANIQKTHTSGTEFDVGETQVTYTASDIHGKIATCSFTVTVMYEDLPQAFDCPTNLTSISNNSDQAVVTWIEPTFTTRCGSLSVQRTHSPGSMFTVGRTEVVYTATDQVGNKAECRFMVDVELPELDIAISILLTPDNDGFNDYWKITNLENYPDNQVTVFDRWGSVLYKSSGYNNQSVVWTGTNKNNASLPTGTYYYVIEITYGRQRIKREGFIELVR